MQSHTAPVISDSTGLPVLLTGEAPTVHLRIRAPEFDFEVNIAGEPGLISLIGQGGLCPYLPSRGVS